MGKRESKVCEMVNYQAMNNGKQALI